MAPRGAPMPRASLLASDVLTAGMRNVGHTRLGISVVATVTVTMVAGAFGLLDPVALAITVGGGIGVAAMTFSRERIRGAWALVQVAVGAAEDPEDVVGALKRLARIHRLE